MRAKVASASAGSASCTTGLEPAAPTVVESDLAGTPGLLALGRIGNEATSQLVEEESGQESRTSDKSSFRT